ncbi:hypothetical protein [Paenibacillus sp.]|uniref:hypothetical protein n=1 Tax=Paenibacillus sp. TaxID=58172 RepID=UPI002D6A3691|nr:hypothetical protein [Paenibacillus sp.]HZG56235.1 hypothetical protein [Paenibacillus sp.]
MTLEIRNLSRAAFAPYGDLIAPDPAEGAFQVVIREPDELGWRIAVSQLTRRPVDCLGAHANSRESFEPLSGICVILVAQYETPERMEAFLLDAPVCLHRNTWHSVIALSERAVVKITENDRMESETFPLPALLDIGMFQKPA